MNALIPGDEKGDGRKKYRRKWQNFWAAISYSKLQPNNEAKKNSMYIMKIKEDEIVSRTKTKSCVAFTRNCFKVLLL